MNGLTELLPFVRGVEARAQTGYLRESPDDETNYSHGFQRLRNISAADSGEIEDLPGRGPITIHTSPRTLD